MICTTMLRSRRDRLVVSTSGTSEGQAVRSGCFSPVGLLQDPQPQVADMSHDQFWSPVTSPSHVRDVQSLFHFSIEPDEDWEVSLQDLRSLGAHDVSEIFSPPRLTEKCRNYGLLPGYAVDLETGWNLLNPNHVKSLERILDEEDPYLVTGSSAV